MCDVPSGSIEVILDALWNQSSPSYSMPPTAGKVLQNFQDIEKFSRL